MLEGIRQKERPGLEGREARLRVGGRRLRGDRERTTQTDKRAGQVPAGNTWRESGTRCSSGCGRRMEELPMNSYALRTYMFLYQSPCEEPPVSRQCHG